MNRFWKYHIDHLLFWLVTVGFHMYTSFSLVGTAGWEHWLLEVIIRNALLALMVYAHLHYLLPVYLAGKRFLPYIGGLLVCFGFYVVIKNTHDVFLTVYTGTRALPFWKYSFYNFSIALFYMAFSLALHLSKEWYLQRQRMRQLELEKLTTELEYLKAQINPHFLFNSLNTIFFQIDKSNESARQTVSKFADMLRYQLYECKAEYVSLEREISYLRNYVDLQRLRKDDRYEIAFDTASDGANIRIAPLVMMPLIENAFKHVSHRPEGNRIHITLALEGKRMKVTVVNTYDDRPASESGGIGLPNLIRRLELQYPDRHTIEVTREKGVFRAELWLDCQV